MRIIIANPYSTPHAPGGAEYSLEQMCRRFVAQGWRIRVVTNCYDGKPRCELRDGYEVQFVESPVILSEGQQVDATSYLRSQVYEQRLFQSLVDAVGETGEITVFIANNAQSFVGVARAGIRTGVPTVGIVRDTQVVCETGVCIDNQSASSAVPCNGLLGAALCMLRFQRQRGLVAWRPIPGVLLDGIRNGWRRARLRKHGLKKMTSVVTISDALSDLVRTIPGMKSREITTIRNFHTAVDLPEQEEVVSFLDALGIESGKFFLFAGRKTYGKGVDLALSAIREVNAVHPDIRLLLLGREKIAAAPHISFVDHESIPQSLLLGVLKSSRALLIPGRWQEGLHRTMIDALRMGIPIICSRVGAPPVEGVMDGENGYVVECENVSAIVGAMLKVLAWDTKTLERCRVVSSKRFQERFSDDVLVAAWKQHFNKLVVGY